MTNKGKIILDLCGGTGSWSKPYKKAEYDVRLITLPEYNVLDYEPPENVYGILAAPPCTEFSLNKNTRHTGSKGMPVVNACLRIIQKAAPVFWAMENPVGRLQGYIGKPKMVFQPYEYGDQWSKRTAVWGSFNMSQKKYTYETCPQIDTLYIHCLHKINSMAWSHKKQILRVPQLRWAAPFVKTDADARAITPPGFARAFFKANQ